MKNWISRLVGGQQGGPNAPEASAADTGLEDQEHRQGRISNEIDGAYYRWLTASAGFNAPADLESAILDQVQALAGRPGDAAELVPRVPEVDSEGIAQPATRTCRPGTVAPGGTGRGAGGGSHPRGQQRLLSPHDHGEDVEAAIMMLGQNGLRMLLARIGFRPVIKMQSDGFSRRAAPQIWGQSEKCALAASLMAPGLSAGVFESYLAGLMQNVGLVVAFRLSDRVCQNGTVPGSSEFGIKLLASSRQLSAAIARHWDFPQDVADAIAHAGDPGDPASREALGQGDRIAKLRLLIDGCVLSEDDTSFPKGWTASSAAAWASCATWKVDPSLLVLR
jgi:hypothetical protein